MYGWRSPRTGQLDLVRGAQLLERARQLAGTPAARRALEQHQLGSILADLEARQLEGWARAVFRRDMTHEEMAAIVDRLRAAEPVLRARGASDSVLRDLIALSIQIEAVITATYGASTGQLDLVRSAQLLERARQLAGTPAGQRALAAQAAAQAEKTSLIERARAAQTPRLVRCIVPNGCPMWFGGRPGYGGDGFLRVVQTAPSDAHIEIYDDDVRRTRRNNNYREVVPPEAGWVNVMYPAWDYVAFYTTGRDNQNRSIGWMRAEGLRHLDGRTITDPRYVTTGAG